MFLINFDRLQKNMFKEYSIRISQRAITRYVCINFSIDIQTIPFHSKNNLFILLNLNRINSFFLLSFQCIKINNLVKHLLINYNEKKMNLFE